MHRSGWVRIESHRNTRALGFCRLLGLLPKMYAGFFGGVKSRSRWVSMSIDLEFYPA